MKFYNPSAEIFVPDGLALSPALARVTHLGIGAHQDDLEFMAFHGILECFGKSDRWFGGVTCTNGSGSSRTGKYANCTDADLMAIRRQEQNAAAKIGYYGVMIQLDYPSSAVKSPTDASLKNDLVKILSATRPETVYTHNPADKHDTHIGVVVAVLQAIREMPDAERPRAVVGCEVWRGLDWMPDAEKVIQDVSAHEKLAAALNGVFDSQIAGGKRYDLATHGRRQANATFFESHATDECRMLSLAMDLTPLIRDPAPDLVEYVLGFIRRFEDDVREKLSRRLGR